MPADLPQMYISPQARILTRMRMPRNISKDQMYSGPRGDLRAGTSGNTAECGETSNHRLGARDRRRVKGAVQASVLQVVP